MLVWVVGRNNRHGGRVSTLYMVWPTVRSKSKDKSTWASRVIRIIFYYLSSVAEHSLLNVSNGDVPLGHTVAGVKCVVVNPSPYLGLNVLKQ